MQKKNLNKLINEYDGDDLATYITDTLDKEKFVKQERSKYQKGISDAELEYKKTRIRLGEKLGKVQADCPHLETIYYGDAAGGSSSSTECDWCGATL